MSLGLRVADFDYLLPPARIAQEPCPQRDASRLMVLDRAAGNGAAPVETVFSRLGDWLRPGDLLVLNESRVLPARLCTVKPTGGRVDLLLLGREGEGEDAPWRCLASTGKGIRPGVRLRAGPGFEAEVLGEGADGRLRVRLIAGPEGPAAALGRHGLMPLPPYIRREPGDPRGVADRGRYQTVFAREDGSIAAPTAGLHFTDRLLEELGKRGVTLARLTLHVGPGTFQPVRAERIEDHRIEPEAFRLPPDTAAAVAECRARSGRIVAVGSTVTRVLEASVDDAGRVRAGSGWCDLFIRPGHRFRVVDALITNFHLPRSSLLILVAAFAGRERILDAYAHAVARGFRFYSYGDAMLIL